MRKTLYASALVLALCGSAFAGDISNPPIAPSTPPSSSSASQPSGVQPDEGQSGTGAPAPGPDGIGGDNADVLAAAALNVLNCVLALF